MMKEKNLQPRLHYPARISFRFDGEIKTFTEKQKLREFSTTKPALQQMLKEQRGGRALNTLGPIGEAGTDRKSVV